MEFKVKACVTVIVVGNVGLGMHCFKKMSELKGARKCQNGRKGYFPRYFKIFGVITLSDLNYRVFISAIATVL